MLTDRRILVGLCLFAAARVFVYSAAFPFFNNVDEHAHFDMVVKYSHGQLPRRPEPRSAESVHYLALYGSQEFLFGKDRFPAGSYPPPVWSLAEPQRSAIVERLAGRAAPENHEFSQAPLYYAIAAVWWHAGRIAGLAGGELLYWVRFMNVPLAAALVWLGYAVARRAFPRRRFMHLGVAVFLAALPQDAFYSIQSDVLTPLCFGVAFLELLPWILPASPSAAGAVFAGLALAATGLTKISTLPLLAVALAVVLVQACRKRAPVPAVLLLLSAGLPLAGWMAWCAANFGDLTGSAMKIHMLGWSRKPLGEWWDHPIFSPSGFGHFWSELMTRFWRGEIVWNALPLSTPVADAFYWLSSMVLAAAAIASLSPRFGGGKDDSGPRGPLVLCGVCFLASAGYLAALSLAFDFGPCLYPSRAQPYFTAGRLMLGALIPFLCVYVRGLEWVAARLGLTRARWWLLAAMALFMAVSAAATNHAAFSSGYNWFHLLPAS